MENISVIRFLALGVLAATLGVGAPAALAQPAAPAAASHPYAKSRPIPGRYIVVFKDVVANPATEAANLSRAHGGLLRQIYTRAIRGFAVSLPDAAVQALQNHPLISYIEQDQTVSLNETVLPQVQNQATWGLDRIDQLDRPLATQYHYNYTATGVSIFIIDTGIRATHSDFNGRVQPGFTSIADGNGTNDCNGHGTHVAATAAGRSWGVAKGATLVPVRVLDCNGSGSWSGVIAGIDWVANRVANATPSPAAVANMSLGGGASIAVDNAVAGAVSKGVTMVVAAGNSNADACSYSPARAPAAITVGATTSADVRASYSNYGSCLDLFAPGSAITSAWHTSDSATNTISGTSMASPHVAGVAALALAASSSASPWAIAAFLTENATPNRVSSIGAGSPGRLVFSLAVGMPQEPAGQTVAVWSLTGSATTLKNGWRASATVTIGAASANTTPWPPVANATVVGSFSPGGSASCVTGASGSCRLTSAIIGKTIGQTKFTAGSVSGDLMNYEPASNVITEITIRR